MKPNEIDQTMEQFLNCLEDKIIAIIFSVAMGFFETSRINFLLIVEKVG